MRFDEPNLFGSGGSGGGGESQLLLTACCLITLEYGGFRGSVFSTVVTGTVGVYFSLTSITVLHLSLLRLARKQIAAIVINIRANISNDAIRTNPKMSCNGTGGVGVLAVSFPEREVDVIPEVKDPPGSKMKSVYHCLGTALCHWQENSVPSYTCIIVIN